MFLFYLLLCTVIDIRMWSLQPSEPNLFLFFFLNIIISMLFYVLSSRYFRYFFFVIKYVCKCFWKEKTMYVFLFFLHIRRRLYFSFEHYTSLATFEIKNGYQTGISWHLIYCELWKEDLHYSSTSNHFIYSTIFMY